MSLSWFHPMCGSLTVVGRERTEPGRDGALEFGSFFAGFVERLQAEADAEKGNAAADGVEQRARRARSSSARISAA